MIDIGPFQMITAVYFPGSQDFQNFVDGEAALLRYNDCDPATQTDVGATISRDPATGFRSTTGPCCGDPAQGCGCKQVAITVTLPAGTPWPSCVVGGTSGTQIPVGAMPPFCGSTNQPGQCDGYSHISSCAPYRFTVWQRWDCSEPA